MKFKPIFIAGLLVFAGAFFTSTARAQKPNPKYNPPKEPPKNVKIFLPDLRIASVTVNGGQMVVEVTNQCKGATPATRLRLDVYGGPEKGSKGGLVLEGDVKPLNAGEKTTVTFNLKEYSAPFQTYGDRYYRLDVDPYNKIRETSEENNWWEKNSSPFPDPSNICEPK